MEFLKETQFIERLQFFDGQRLFASDLQGIEAFNREMRWEHNRNMHQPGIGNGFAVTGKKGDREVTIGPGYAADALGREIILTHNQVEPIPPIAGDKNGNPVLFYLTVAYPKDTDLEETERRTGVCRTSGTVRLKEEPLLCWVRLSETLQPVDPKAQQEISSGMRLILALAEVLNCQLEKDLSIGQRLSARPSRQPYICCGMADPTQWQIWAFANAPIDFNRLEASASSLSQGLNVSTVMFSLPFVLPIGLSAQVDTSDCGFLTTPCYSARIDGPRIKLFEHEFTFDEGKPQTISVSAIVDALVQIVEPSQRGFAVEALLLVQLIMPSDLQALRNKPKNLEEELKKLKEEFLELFSDWRVAWMGIEG
jgi:hypothetical protein